MEVPVPYSIAECNGGIGEGTSWKFPIACGIAECSGGIGVGTSLGWLWYQSGNRQRALMHGQSRVKCPAQFVLHWATSTGLTAVSKIKPHLPAQWAVGTHRKGPSRMENVTSRVN